MKAIVKDPHGGTHKWTVQGRNKYGKDFSIPHKTKKGAQKHMRGMLSVREPK